MKKGKFPLTEEERAVQFLEDPNFYISKVLAVASAKHRIDFSRELEVEEPKTVEEGLFDNALLKRITLHDQGSKEDLNLMAKIYHPLRGAYNAQLEAYVGLEREKIRNRQQRNIDNQWMRVEKDAEFERRHMQAWNLAGVASPLFFSRVSLEIPTFERFREISGHETMPLEVLVSGFLQGPTQDMDLLFLNQELEKMGESTYTAQVSNFHTGSGDLNVDEIIEGLEEKKKQVLLGMMHTADDLSIRMTQMIGSGQRFNTLKTREYAKGPLEERLSRHIRSYTLWRALEEGYVPRIFDVHGSDAEVTLASLHKRTKRRIPRKLRRRLTKLDADLRTASAYLIKTLSEARRVYVQGDEYPHNFKMVREPHIGDGELRSAIFDPDKAGYALPELSKAKILGNNIAQLSPEEIMELYECSVEQGEQIAADLRKCTNISWMRSAQFTHNGKKEFILATIYEMINLLGTNADHHIQKHHSERFMKLLLSTPFENKPSPYDNPLLFDEYLSESPTVSARLYEPKLANPYTARQLEGMFDLVIDSSKPWVDSRMKRGMEKLYRFLDTKMDVFEGRGRK